MVVMAIFVSAIDSLEHFRLRFAMVSKIFVGEFWTQHGDRISSQGFWWDIRLPPVAPFHAQTDYGCVWHNLSSHYDWLRVW